MVLRGNGAAGLIFCHGLNQRPKRRVFIADNIEGEIKYFAQISDPHLLVGPLRDLPQRVFGPELLDFHADDFGESGGDFLCDASLIRGKVEPDKCHHEGPVRALGAVSEYDLSDTHQQDNCAEADINRLNHSSYGSGNSLRTIIALFTLLLQLV